MIPTLLFILGAIFYSSMQMHGIYGGDSGELVAAAFTGVVAHAPGYPLYVMLGWLVSHGVPFFSVAWRVGLVSSLSAAASLFFVWKILEVLTKHKIIATIATVFYALLYPVWLYSISAEVFGLYALFSSALLYVFLLCITTKKARYVLLLSYLTGLSLTHHHLIVLLLAPIVFYFYRNRQTFKAILPRRRMIVGLFLLGLLPYVYPIVISFYHLPATWNYPADPAGFFRLITRAEFGTFRASAGLGGSLTDRLFNLTSFFQYVMTDFTLLGVLCIIAGFITLAHKYPRIFPFFLLYVGFLIFFFFYAAFPVNINFGLGTLERFFIMPYQILAILWGVGVWGILLLIQSLWRKRTSQIQIPVVFVTGIFLAFALTFPLRQFKKNYKNLSLLTYDQTFDTFIDDFLLSVPPDAIINPTEDTTANALGYAQAVLHKRPDITVVSFGSFKYPAYRQFLKKSFPEFIVPEILPQELPNELLARFVQENYRTVPIIQDRDDGGDNFWVPHGLVLVFYPNLESIPNRELTIQKNYWLWQSFHDPQAGALGQYKHLLLSDILRVYADHHLQFAQALAYMKRYEESQSQIEEAIKLDTSRSSVFRPYFSLLMEQQKCDEAKKVLDDLAKSKSDLWTLELNWLVYTKCFPDDPRTASYIRDYETLKKRNEIPL